MGMVWGIYFMFGHLDPLGLIATQPSIPKGVPELRARVRSQPCLQARMFKDQSGLCLCAEVATAKSKL